MTDVFAWCKANKDALLKALAEGDTLARNIVLTHDMQAAVHEHAGEAILEMLVEDWQKRAEKEIRK